MATSSFTQQLQKLAASSTHELDLRARRNLHSESLLFPMAVAAKQDWETIYSICHEGFKELCDIDARFNDFAANLFSAQSARMEREQMSQQENDSLDGVIARFLGLVSGRVLLAPGLKCVEWLVRRFRIHSYNTTALILMVLPYHEMAIARNVLSIIPREKLVGELKWMAPYKKENGNVPRHTIVHAATNNNGFFTRLNTYVIETCRAGAGHPALLRFWGSVVTEAVSRRLDQVKSGIKEVYRQKTEDALLVILPVLSDGFEVTGAKDLTMCCFTLAMVVAATANLDDRVLDSLLQAVATVAMAGDVDTQAAIVTMTVIVGQKQESIMPKAGVDAISLVPHLEETMAAMTSTYPVAVLINSLIRGTILTIKRKNLTKRISLIETLLQYAGKSQQSAFKQALQAVLLNIDISDTPDSIKGQTRSALLDMLQRLNDDEKLSTLIADTVTLKQDKEKLEALLGTTVALLEPPSIDDANMMDLDLPPTIKPSYEYLLSKIPQQTETTSFLAQHDTHLFKQLNEAFNSCYKHEPALHKFIALPVWLSSKSATALFHSFLLRIGIGSSNIRERSTAFDVLGRDVRKGSTIGHYLVPSLLVAMNEPSIAVRKSVGNVLIAIGETVAAAGDQAADLSNGNIYDNRESDNTGIIQLKTLSAIVHHTLLPNMEECLLDASYIIKVVKVAMNGSQDLHSGLKSGLPELKKSTRHSFFEFLTSHAVSTPLLRVKIGILRLLEDVSKVGTSTKSKSLAPILKAWASNGQDLAFNAAMTEGLQLPEIDNTMMQLITANDKVAIEQVFDMFEQDKITIRPALISAFFDRLQLIWDHVKSEIQVAAALKLYKFSFSENSAVQDGAQGVLHKINLQTSIIGGILEQSLNNLALLQGDEQPKKRRRTSNGRDSLPSPELSKAINTTVSRLTLALELADNSNVETRPELAPVLFDTLASLKRLKQQQHLDSPYLLNLCLGCILAIINGQRNIPKPVIDLSAIRADVVTECIRASENPQVQNTALMLSASLASLAPDRMLHHVMPIFTFMGQSMLAKEDDHSVHVTNQAIDQIVPALVASLRNQNKDLIRSSSALLLSFAAAFDHILQSRRVAVYQRLLRRLGAHDFAFIIVAMLALRKANDITFATFLNDLMSEFPALVRLITFRKLIDLANDALSLQPSLAHEVLEMSKSATFHEKQSVSKVVSAVALTILKSKDLKVQVSKVYKLDAENINMLRSELNTCLSELLLTIRIRREASENVDEIKQCLDALLELPSLSELFNMLPQLLSSMEGETDLKAQALRVIASQLESHTRKDNRTRLAAIELLSTLTNMLDTQIEDVMRQAIIVAIDRISEAYGRKDVEVVLTAAQAICGNTCLGSTDRRLKNMSLLCLASLLEVLKEACIPIVPELTVEVLNILEKAIQHPDEEMHNSSYTLLSSIASHVPFLISDENLSRIMVLSTFSARNYESISAKESRTEALTTIARKVDISSVLESHAGDDLDEARRSPETAELEKLDVLSLAVENASKANITKNADSISQTMLAHLDQRNRFQLTESANMDALNRIEDILSQISIKFVYKLNDTTFRPIFESWVDWAINAYDVASESRDDEVVVARQISLFKILNGFFTTLKSIVTSYASYLLRPASKFLDQIVTSSTGSKRVAITSQQTTLYTTLLDLLATTFTHDADGFFSTPAHFDPLGPTLISQLNLASVKTQRSLVYSHVVPTIVALVTATLDTPAHHQTLSHYLTQLRHSSSAAVRLASIKTLATLSSDEDIGDDWIANTIGVGSASAGDGDAVGITRGGGSSAGEIMIYVNEMLEDDDEEVEMSVRRWVQAVREKVGEDVFEV